MPRKKIIKKSKAIESYAHEGEKRKNNPPVGLVSSATDKLGVGKKKYKHDPHIDPYLSWAGRKEGTEFEVPNVSLHIHERIDPKRITKTFLKKDIGPRQASLFEQPDNVPPLHKAIDFYKHEQDWTNRLIAGDSLLVMNSLLNKEGMAGKVQMVYIDPPYGIKYNSNFQPFVNKRDVKDKDEDIPAEPEMIQAFRDTWELGIHSYLTHLRDRLLLARELLHESGSCFVQINDENVHYVKQVMQEVFGYTNCVNIIPFKKRASYLDRFGKGLFELFDYIVWYAKDIKKLRVNTLYKSMNKEENLRGEFRYYEERDGIRTITEEDILNANLDLSKVFRTHSASKKSADPKNIEPIEIKGKNLYPPKGHEWKTDSKGIEKLKKLNRIIGTSQSRPYKIYFTDFPYRVLNNLWDDTLAEQFPIYAVQTDELPIQRCMLLTTMPGDLVLDITCGSGTTAFVAEQWGRRWITCDTSRVAITLAKQRLMTSKFNYYQLAHKEEGVLSGFKYETVPHITLASIANNESAKEETLYDKPIVEKNKLRVTGPFTVEAVPSLRVKSFDGKEQKIEGTGRELAYTGETGNQTLWRDELKSTGIRSTGGKTILFSRIEPMLGTQFLHAEGEILEKNGDNKKAVINFGPDYGPLEQRQVEEAIKEARSLKEKPDFVIFAAFHFDPEAAKDIDQIDWPDVKILKTQMSVDLLTSDLRKKRSSNQSYWLIGQPDVEVEKQKDGKYVVSIHGFDYYNPVTGEIESKNNKHIAMWFLDTDYDERSLLPEQVFFPNSDKKRDWTRLAKALNGDVDEDLLEAFSGTKSLPFEAGDKKKIAVKIIDNRGIESFVIKDLD
ncbi:site-specific DNA-methyltransferase [Candidatus Falkowbacteria bacterium]|nr:site-specific DNA-methyltransferase [Candidatus Falkowbacteria bacterium]